jgi:hypothetical protein
MLLHIITVVPIERTEAFDEFGDVWVGGENVVEEVDFNDCNIESIQYDLFLADTLNSTVNALPTNGVYRIRNVESGLYLRSNGSSQCTQVTFQNSTQWQVTRHGNTDEYVIQPSNSTHRLHENTTDVNGRDDVVVISSSQRWRLISNGHGTYSIVSPTNGRMMVSQDRQQNTRIIMHPPLGWEANHNWIFESITQPNFGYETRLQIGANNGLVDFERNRIPGDVGGTTGYNIPLRNFRVTHLNNGPAGASVEYQVRFRGDNFLQPPRMTGEWAVAQTNTREIDEIRFDLSVGLKNQGFNIFYRVYVSPANTRGWTDWVRGPTPVGWLGPIEAIQVVIIHGTNISASSQANLANTMLDREKDGFWARYRLYWDEGFGVRAGIGEINANRRSDYYVNGLISAFQLNQGNNIRVRPFLLNRQFRQSSADICRTPVGTHCHHHTGNSHRPCTNDNDCQDRLSHKNISRNREELPNHSINNIASVGLSGHFNCLWFADDNGVYACRPNLISGLGGGNKAITSDWETSTTVGSNLNSIRVTFVHEFAHMYDASSRPNGRGHCENSCIMGVRSSFIDNQLIICLDCRNDIIRNRRKFHQ